MHRREFLKVPIALSMLQACKHKNTFSGQVAPQHPIILNDLHSRLNPTAVAEVYTPTHSRELSQYIEACTAASRKLSVSAGMHAMGGQQFGKDTHHISAKRLNQVIGFDDKRGTVTVQAGIEWPKLIEYLLHAQRGREHQWGIVQKQTGADSLSIGGAVSANAHGRGVKFKPFVQDVESLQVVLSSGEQVRLSRTEHPDLFSLVIGGYGLFGVISEVELRLQPRYQLERVVEIVPIEGIPEKVKARLAEGYTYGDYQYKTDSNAKDFMKTGVFSCYRPVTHDLPLEESQRELSTDEWNHLLYLAHADKARAFEYYAKYYLTTSGQRYWSDTHQLSYYNNKYVEYLSQRDARYSKQSLMITEVYVPREELLSFTDRVAVDAQRYGMDIIYGTMRLIERDDETFLPWARKNYACIIFNLAVEHSPEGLAKAQGNFQRLIDRALELGGSYFLTYHRWARKEQVLEAYPQFPEFLGKKQRFDPSDTFQSDWFRFYRDMFA